MNPDSVKNSKPKIGVLLMAMGTPAAPTYWAIRRYLSEFLSDRRVIELSPFLWQPILQGIILTFRPQRLCKLYKKIWDFKANKSPLALITQHQAEALHQQIDNPDIEVEWAMRYGKPTIAQQINRLVESGCTHILALPLYPQYSSTTTASALDNVFKHMQCLRNQPALKTLTSFADYPHYIEALTKTVQQHLSQRSTRPQHIIVSFHGLPKKYVEAGDPYEDECEKTFYALRQALIGEDFSMSIAYQSQFGPNQWLEPNIKDVMKNLLNKGVKDISVIAPSFFADCLETLEEISHTYKEQFLAAGGKHFSYIPCLNDSKDAISMLEKLIKEQLKGWLTE